MRGARARWLLVLAWTATAISEAHAQESAGFAPVRCEEFFETEPVGRVECGYVTVSSWQRDAPRDRARLAVVVLRSTGDAPAPDPIIHLAGGPGGDSIPIAEWAMTSSEAWAVLRSRRDLVFFDQRGTGRSAPPVCQRLEGALWSVERDVIGLEARTRARVEAVSACRAEMERAGVDPSAFTVLESARDVETIRTALGYGAANLYGSSYGTLLALVTAGTYPEGTRALVLDGVWPPDQSFWTNLIGAYAGALSRTFEICEASTTCRERFPDPEEDFYSLLEAYAADPARLALRGERFDDPIVLDGQQLAELMHQGLYDPDFAAVLPLLVDALSTRDTDLLKVVVLMRELLVEEEPTGWLLNFGVHCSSSVPLAPPESIARSRALHPRLAAHFEEPWRPAACEAWRVPEAPSAALAAARSDAPALFFSGGLDPVTPPPLARAALAGLPRGTHVVFPALSHVVVERSPCAQNIVRAFLDRPTEPVDTSCVADAEPLRMETELLALPLTRGLLLALFEEAPRWPWITWLVLLVAEVLALFALLVAWVRRRLSKRPAVRDRARAAGALAVALALLSVFVLGAVIVVAAGANPYVLLIGMPRDALFAAPLWAASATLALATCAAAIRRRGRGEPFGVPVALALLALLADAWLLGLAVA